MGGDACARYWSDVDYFGREEEIVRSLPLLSEPFVCRCAAVSHVTPDLVPILRHDGHTLDATLLSLSCLTRDAPSTGAVEREDGEDKKQNKNDRRTLHLLLGGEKIYT